jgi:methylenetetrahydrofolate reductase (NADPH)
MSKINEKLKIWQAEKPGVPWFSFEYFPPKTDLGTQNLYERFDRMAPLDPMWIDVTWGAGGSTADKTLEICINALKYHGLNVMMHLTCTNMPKEKLKEALDTCKENGICNILALRGDPPGHLEQGAASEGFKVCEGGFAYATDLVKYIRSEFGDYFCIAVAGYPEGHLEATSFDDDMKHLKEKVDAGADLIVTQLFYDNPSFLAYVDKCKEMGITIPILPGIMPIQSYAGFNKMTALCKTKVPEGIPERLDAVKDDDEKVKDMGVQIGIEQCKELIEKGTPGLHFYTLNLESSVMRIVQGLGLVPDWTSTRTLPWKQSADRSRATEDVRPIFWANRPGSYVRRTATWDDFPNGRFGDRASPAYGDYGFVSYSRDPEDKAAQSRRAMWGECPKKAQDVNKVFVKFIKNDIKKLPWCSEAPAKETNFIAKQLIKLNDLGLLTINSQPRVNASLSTDPYVGWGPSGGFVYQKAYCEFFCAKDTLDKITAGMGKKSTFSYMAVNKKGEKIGNVKSDSVNAVTWGVFPAREVMQPTVVDVSSFMAWKDEAFSLWGEWSSIYAAGSESKKLIESLADTYYLVNIVDDNFVCGDLLNNLIEWIS